MVKLTTTDTVPGFDSIHSLGLLVACIPFWGSKYAEGIGDLNGNTNTDVAAAYEARRRQVLQRLTEGAISVGANAVVGIRFTDREITTTWKELCAYGTAVILRSKT